MKMKRGLIWSMLGPQSGHNFVTLIRLGVSFLIGHYTDRNLVVESTIFDGKPEPLGISAS